MNIKDKIKEIKYLRMKPEERFVLDIINDLEECYHPKYDNLIFFRKNLNLIFRYDIENGDLWCNYEHIWRILEKRFELKYEDIQFLIKYMLEKHLFNNSINPSKFYSENFRNIDKELQHKSDINPSKLYDAYYGRMEKLNTEIKPVIGNSRQEESIIRILAVNNLEIK